MFIFRLLLPLLFLPINADLYYQDWQRGGGGGVGDDGVDYKPVHGRKTKSERQFQEVIDAGGEQQRQTEDGADFFDQDFRCEDKIVRVVRTLPDDAFANALEKNNNVVKSGVESVKGEDGIYRDVMVDYLKIPWAGFREQLRNVEDAERGVFLVRAKRELSKLAEETGMKKEQMVTLSPQDEVVAMVKQIKTLNSGEDAANPKEAVCLQTEW